MSNKPDHTYHTQITWTGNNGAGTSDYKSYERSHTLSIAGKADLHCSSDPYFRGDATKHNPEEFLVAALSSCHMLWYLHICANNGINITGYQDNATGIMKENENGGGHFSEVILNPVVIITDKTQIEKANALHEQANKKCFIANSCNFPVKHSPVCMARENDSNK